MTTPVSLAVELRLLVLLVVVGYVPMAAGFALLGVPDWAHYAMAGMLGFLGRRRMLRWAGYA